MPRSALNIVGAKPHATTAQQCNYIQQDTRIQYLEVFKVYEIIQNYGDYGWVRLLKVKSPPVFLSAQKGFSLTKRRIATHGELWIGNLNSSFP